MARTRTTAFCPRWFGSVWPRSSPRIWIVRWPWPTGLRLPSLADSIRWFITRQPAGMRSPCPAQLAARSRKTWPPRNLRLLAFGLKDDAGVAMPAAWPQVERTIRKIHRPYAALRDAADQLAAIFGDKAVLAKMRGVLGDEKQPAPRRQLAFDLLKRANDPEAVPPSSRDCSTSTPFARAATPCSPAQPIQPRPKPCSSASPNLMPPIATPR